MHTVSIEEAQNRLPELIKKLGPGEEVVITSNQEPIAKILKERRPPQGPRQPGSAKDKILYMADYFDAPFEDFKEYMD